ncbi:MAG: extracellular solute-binding protein [Bacteriovoracaceae bacterium]|jgi:iron(III) transport system substrate-binding protein|nr:extracellular solute-binding protein [Bacteriovoracaceae bacterium]
MRILIPLVVLGLLVGCQKESTDGAEAKELWIYTSMYKDTISDISPRLKKAFPGVKFNFYQAGSEDIASKVNAELMAGGTKADILISSDRFWYEEMASSGNLFSYKSDVAKGVPDQLRHADGFYTTVSVPVMVLSYNSDAVSDSEAPKTFKEMADPKWKGKFTTGSPLASGTNFTTMAMLQHHYGWDYFVKLRDNETIAQGGNSAVIRRMQSKERPVGWVLLENLLRFQGKDTRLKIIYPEDGAVTHTNVMAITKKSGSRELAKKFVDWMFKKEGQEAMTRSFMYSPLNSIAPPVGAPVLSKLLKNSFPWSNDFVKKVTKDRMNLKEKYSEIMFQ